MILHACAKSSPTTTAKAFGEATFSRGDNNKCKRSAGTSGRSR